MLHNVHSTNLNKIMLYEQLIY